MSQISFLIVGDLHGQIPKIKFKGFNAIIAPGDFCSDEARKYIFKAMKKNMQGDDADWTDFIDEEKEEKLLMKSMEKGRKVMEFLNRQNVPVFTVPGNWDEEPVYEIISIGLDNMHNCDEKMIDIGEYIIIGYGKTSGPEYPIHKEIKESYSRKEIRKLKKAYKNKLKMYKKMFNHAKKLKKPIIFLSHNVPFNTKLDLVKNKDSPMDNLHMGSFLVKELVEKYQPLLCIGGHIHEGYGIEKIGKTICINAGFGSTANTHVVLQNGEVKLADQF